MNEDRPGQDQIGGPRGEPTRGQVPPGLTSRLGISRLGDPEMGAGLDAIVRFQHHRTVLPAANRIPWRLSLLVLVVAKCNSQTASVGTLHLLMWGLRGRTPRALLQAWLTGVSPADLISSRMDPQLETTIRLAAAEQLVELTATGRVHLLERGKELAALIDAESSLLAAEKEALSSIRPLNDRSIAMRMGGALDGT